MKMTCIQIFTCKFTSAFENICNTRAENLAEIDVTRIYEEKWTIYDPWRFYIRIPRVLVPRPLLLPQVCLRVGALGGLSSVGGGGGVGGEGFVRYSYPHLSFVPLYFTLTHFLIFLCLFHIISGLFYNLITEITYHV